MKNGCTLPFTVAGSVEVVNETLLQDIDNTDNLRINKELETALSGRPTKARPSVFFQDIDKRPYSPVILRIVAEELDADGRAAGEPEGNVLKAAKRQGSRWMARSCSDCWSPRGCMG